MPNGKLRRLVIAIFVFSFSRVVLCSHWSWPKMGHDSVLDVFKKPRSDTSRLNSTASSLKFWTQSEIDDIFLWRSIIHGTTSEPCDKSFENLDVVQYIAFTSADGNNKTIWPICLSARKALTLSLGNALLYSRPHSYAIQFSLLSSSALFL